MFGRRQKNQNPPETGLLGEETHPVLGKSVKDLFFKMGHYINPEAEAIQAQTALQYLMVRNLIRALDRNSASADRLASVLNWFTFFLVSIAIVELVLRYAFPTH